MKTKFKIKLLVVITALLLAIGAFNISTVKGSDVTPVTESKEEIISTNVDNLATGNIGGQTPDASQTAGNGNAGTQTPDASQTAGNGNAGTQTPDANQTAGSTGTQAPDASQTAGSTGTQAPDASQTAGNGNAGTQAPDANQTAGSTGTQAPDANQGAGNTGAQTPVQNTITPEEILALIPNEIKVTVKESEAVYSAEVEKQVNKVIEEALAKEGIKVENNQLKDLKMHYYAYNSYVDTFDIYHFDIGLISTENYESLGRKQVKITYSNSDKRNDTDAKYVKDKIANFTPDIWTTIELGEYPEYDTIEASFKSQFKKALKDDSIKIELTWQGEGGYWFWWKYGFNVYFFKNDVLYEIKEYTFNVTHQITVPDDVRDTAEAYIAYALPKLKDWLIEENPYYLGTFDDITITKKEGNYYYLHGEAIDEGDIIVIKKAGNSKPVDYVTVEDQEYLKIEGTIIDEKNENYAEMVEKVQEKGYNYIFNAYELNVVTGEIEDKLEITFDIGEANNGKKMIVLHKLHDGSFEEFVRTVVNGKISITVKELSPFMVASKEPLLDGEPKTGTNNLVVLTSLISVISIAGIVVCKFKKIV